MTARAFSSPAGRAALGAAVADAETRTSAEIVVAIRRHAAPYHGTSVAVGAVCALAAFAHLWLSPLPYEARLMPLEAAVAFLLGAFLCHSVDPLRRVLTPSAHRERTVVEAAERAFHALGVERTRARNGLLVYVALMEGTVALRPDEGIELGALGDEGRALERRLRDAVHRRDLEAFCASVRDLGTLLGTTHVRGEDDENELCDVHH